MNCSDCGAFVTAQRAVCLKCGAPRPGRTGDYPLHWPNDYIDLDPPLQTVELLAYADESGEAWDDGSPLDYYLRKWRPILEGRSSWAGFNWASFCFGLHWCFWRKLYFVGFIVLAAEFFAGLLFALPIIVGTGTTDPTNPALIASGYLALLPTRLLLGIFSNRLYLRRANYAIQSARARESDLKTRVALLRRNGGTNSWAPAISLLLRFIINTWALFS